MELYPTKDLYFNKNVYLEVPYIDKDTVIKLGAKWDKKLHYWYVPKGDNLEPFVLKWALCPISENTLIRLKDNK